MCFLLGFVLLFVGNVLSTRVIYTEYNVPLTHTTGVLLSEQEVITLNTSVLLVPNRQYGVTFEFQNVLVTRTYMGASGQSSTICGLVHTSTNDKWVSPMCSYSAYSSWNYYLQLNAAGPTTMSSLAALTGVSVPTGVDASSTGFGQMFNSGSLTSLISLTLFVGPLMRAGNAVNVTLRIYDLSNYTGNFSFPFYQETSSPTSSPSLFTTKSTHIPSSAPTTTFSTRHPTLIPTTALPSRSPTHVPTANLIFPVPTSNPTISSTSPTFGPTVSSFRPLALTSSPTPDYALVSTNNPTTAYINTFGPTASLMRSLSFAPTTSSNSPTQSISNPVTSPTNSLDTFFTTASPATTAPTLYPTQQPTRNPTTLNPTVQNQTLIPTTTVPTTTPTAQPTHPIGKKITLMPTPQGYFAPKTCDSTFIPIQYAAEHVLCNQSLIPPSVSVTDDTVVGNVVTIKILNVTGTEIPVFNLSHGIIFFVPFIENCTELLESGSGGCGSQRGLTCVWYDETRWMDTGCQLSPELGSSNENGMAGRYCTCNHLTSFTLVLRDHRDVDFRPISTSEYICAAVAALIGFFAAIQGIRLVWELRAFSMVGNVHGAISVAAFMMMIISLVSSTFASFPSMLIFLSSIVTVLELGCYLWLVYLWTALTGKKLKVPQKFKILFLVFWILTAVVAVGIPIVMILSSSDAQANLARIGSYLMTVITALLCAALSMSGFMLRRQLSRAKGRRSTVGSISGSREKRDSISLSRSRSRAPSSHSSPTNHSHESPASPSSRTSRPSPRPSYTNASGYVSARPQGNEDSVPTNHVARTISLPTRILIGSVGLSLSVMTQAILWTVSVTKAVVENDTLSAGVDIGFHVAAFVAFSTLLFMFYPGVQDAIVNSKKKSSPMQSSVPMKSSVPRKASIQSSISKKSPLKIFRKITVVSEEIPKLSSDVSSEITQMEQDHSPDVSPGNPDASFQFQPAQFRISLQRIPSFEEKKRAKTQVLFIDSDYPEREPSLSRGSQNSQTSQMEQYAHHLQPVGLASQYSASSSAIDPPYADDLPVDALDEQSGDSETNSETEG